MIGFHSVNHTNTLMDKTDSHISLCWYVADIASEMIHLRSQTAVKYSPPRAWNDEVAEPIGAALAVFIQSGGDYESFNWLEVFNERNNTFFASRERQQSAMAC